MSAAADMTGAAGHDAAADMTGGAGHDVTGAAGHDAAADVTGAAGHDAAADLTGAAGHDASKDASPEASSDGKPGDGASEDADAGGLPMPVLHYTFDSDGTNTGSAAGDALMWRGTVTFVPGKIGNAASFAHFAYGEMQGDARAVFGVSPEYTIAFWAKGSDAPDTNSSFLDVASAFAYFGGGGMQLRYKSATEIFVCAGSTTKPLLPTGSYPCPSFPAPSIGVWHSFIIRYAGTGLGPGQGANLEVYVDGALAYTVQNDAANNPIFSPSVSQYLDVGYGGVALDDLRVFTKAFTLAEQCTWLIGGAWNGTSCALP
jgi:hypothetical protein